MIETGRDGAVEAPALVEALDIHARYSGSGRHPRRNPVRAVDGVDLRINAGETLGLVGESGCGKSTLGRIISGLRPPTAGSLRYEGRDFASLHGNQRRALRQKMQVVFQDPFGSLDPRMSIRSTIAEPLQVHRLARGKDLDDAVVAILATVGLGADMRFRYPHEFSGGQRQRIAIARALATRPSFIFCDEPVSALDVSVQAQVLNLFLDLQAKQNLAYLFVSHDLAVVRRMAQRVAVMYLGRIVESGSTQEIYSMPAHPYTKALLSATPEPHEIGARERIILTGDLPSPSNPPSGCSFHTRCWLYEQRDRPSTCTTDVPKLRPIGLGQVAACHFAETVEARTPENAGTHV